MRKYLLTLAVGAALAALVASSVLVAQPVTQNNVSGNECWNAGQGPGGPSSFLCINLVRNGSAMLPVSGSGAVVTTATQANSTLYWVGTAPTTWTITLPTPAFDGEIITVGTNTTLTTMVTVNPGAGTTLDGTYNAQTITALTSVEFQYTAPTTKWYRLR
jgi:hypothetical protein